MDREITLRDYGRVVWSGRWLILAAAGVAALVGLLLSLASTTTYTATAELFLGQATTVAGSPVSTPATNPATAPTVLTGDELVERVAAQIGVEPGRVRDGVSLTSPRAPGGAVGNQPTVATITFIDRDREVAVEGANAYARAVLASAREGFDGVAGTYEAGVARARADVERLEASIQRYQRQLEVAAGTEREAAFQSLLLSASQQLSAARSDLSNQEEKLIKERQIGQPDVISFAQTPASSGSLPNRLRVVVFAAVIGLIVGLIITFVWRGSPAGRAGRE